MNTRRFALFGIFLLMPILALAQGSRGTATTTVEGKRVSINYGRPSLEGRDMFALAGTGTIWRLGQNEATEITTEVALMAGGKHLNAGKYSLWARKTGDTTWMLAFHPRTGIWGLPVMRDGFVAEVPLRVETGAPNTDLLSISLRSAGKDVSIEVHWGTSKLLGTFQAM